MSSQYKSDSIKKLDPLSFTRLRPDTYCGSTEDSTQLVVEIVTNSIDEHLIGNCDRIKISYNEELNEVYVADNGQGILANVYPVEGDDRTVLEMVYGDVNVSGKFDKSSDAVYKVSTGAFGIGASLANYLSHYFIARTCRDGRSETVHFEEGKFKSRSTEKAGREEHGVEVWFQPSDEFFTDPRPNFKTLVKKLNGICALCPNLTIDVCGDEISNNSIVDIIADSVDIDNVFSFTYVDPDDNTRSLSVAYGTRIDGKDTIVSGYANYGAIESGTAYQVIRTQIAKSLTDWGRTQAVLKPKETVTVSSIQDDMCLAFNIVSQKIRYDSQTKVRMSSTADNQFIKDAITQEMSVWMDANPLVVKDIIDKAMLSKRAAEAAKKARDAVKGKAQKKNKLFKLPTKLADCHTRDRMKAEVYVTEGDSASGTAKSIRNPETQAVFPLRGKVLNLFTASADKASKNEEIVGLLNALGFDYSFAGGKLKVTYDKRKLRYGKFIIMSDADIDGYHIQMLIISFLWNTVPDMIKDGFVYIARPALYKVEYGTEYEYLQDKHALESWAKRHPKKKYLLSYFKGIGEISPDEVWAMLLNPETRCLQRVEVTDAVQADSVLKDLMGKDAAPKKKFIFG